MIFRGETGHGPRGDSKKDLWGTCLDPAKGSKVRGRHGTWKEGDQNKSTERGRLELSIQEPFERSTPAPGNGQGNQQKRVQWKDGGLPTMGKNLKGKREQP